MTQVVNGLTEKTEMGALMAVMYLLKHPDHYTDHTFKPCFWKSFITEVGWTAGVELTNKEIEAKDQVVIDKKEDEYISFTRHKRACNNRGIQIIKDGVQST